MKRMVLMSMMTIVACLGLYAQVVDEKGEKNYTANVAIVVKETMYSVDDGKMVEIDVQGREKLSSAYNLWLNQQFAQNGFLIVNNDPMVNEKINAVIEENKLEEYIDGLAVQAKNVGAQFIALLDYATYMENNKYVTFDYSFRFIDVTTNVAIHKHVTHEAVCNSSDELNLVAANLFTMFSSEFKEFFNSQFLPQFIVNKVEGKKTYLSATRQMPLNADAVVDYYKWTYEKYPFQGTDMEFCTLDYLTSSAPLRKAKIDQQTGAIQINSEKQITVNSQELLGVAETKWFSVGTNIIQNFFTFVELPYDETSSEGYARKTLNSAVYHALSNHPNNILIIESDLLPELKKERERQKEETYMYSENNLRKEYLEMFQAGAFGAQYLIDVTDFKTNPTDWKKVSFVLNFHYVEKNAQLQSYEITNCHISNLKAVIQYYVNQLLNTPVCIVSYDSKQLTVVSPSWIKADAGDIFELYNYVENVNPVTGEKIYQIVTIAEYKYLEWKGQKHVFELHKVLNKDLYNQMDELIQRDKEDRANFTMFKKIEEPTKIEKDKSVFDKNEKKEKLLNALGDISFN